MQKDATHTPKILHIFQSALWIITVASIIQAWKNMQARCFFHDRALITVAYDASFGKELSVCSTASQTFQRFSPSTSQNWVYERPNPGGSLQSAAETVFVDERPRESKAPHTRTQRKNLNKMGDKKPQQTASDWSTNRLASTRVGEKHTKTKKNWGKTNGKWLVSLSKTSKPKLQLLVRLHTLRKVTTRINLTVSPILSSLSKSLIHLKINFNQDFRDI